MQKGSSLASPIGQKPGSEWRVEGETMLAAGLELQRLALTLDVDSKVRHKLLADAKVWFTRAQGHGVTAGY